MLIDHVERSQVFNMPNRRFMFDDDAAKHIGWVFREYDGVLNLIEKFGKWAKPPFDKCYIEYACGNVKAGYIINNSNVKFLVLLADDPELKYGIFDFDLDTMEFYISDTSPTSIGTNDEEAIRALSIMLGWLIAALLMLNMPSTHKFNLVKMSQAKSIGKRVIYAAHNNVIINLAEAEQELKGFTTGYRGPNRAHEVRAHWVNWYKVQGCEHNFIPRDPENFDEMTPKYICSQCGQLRSRVLAYDRGDSSLGWVTKTYTVTHDPDNPDGRR